MDKKEIENIIDKSVQWNYSETSLEDKYVILVDNKLVQLKSGFMWNKSWAETMMRRLVYPVGRYSNLHGESIAKKLGCEHNRDFQWFLFNIKEEWLRKHARIIPFKEYIKLQDKKSK